MSAYSAGHNFTVVHNTSRCGLRMLQIITIIITIISIIIMIIIMIIKLTIVITMLIT